MDKKDVEFLKELQNEMNTQDTVCQASPRFWVVMQTVRTFGIDAEYADNSVIVGEDGEECATDIKSIAEWLKDTLEIECNLDDNNWIEIDDTCLFDADDVIKYLKENTGFDQYSIAYYKDEEQIVKDTMFLTNKSCKEHIKANHYHYNSPHSYAMTAWRSPEVARLFKILETTNWDELLESEEEQNG